MMRAGEKICCAKMEEKKVESQVKNYFMFDEEESKAGDKGTNPTNSTEKSKIIEFCADKPYRLALYVHPSKKRRVDPSDSKLLANLTQMRHIDDKSNNKTATKKARRGRTKIEKENIATLFEEQDTNEYQKRSRKLDDSNSGYGEKSDKIAKKGILSFLNTNESVSRKPENEEGHLSLSKVKEKRPCRSYVKKNKEITDPEKLVPTVEEEINEKEMKKHTKAKVKKDDKKEINDEEEFEKWAQSINSGFEEVDKFELSITYD